MGSYSDGIVNSMIHTSVYSYCHAKHFYFTPSLLAEVVELLTLLGLPFISSSKVWRIQYPILTKPWSLVGSGEQIYLCHIGFQEKFLFITFMQQFLLFSPIILVINTYLPKEASILNSDDEN